MNAAPPIRIRRTTWQADEDALRLIRKLVFIDEQRVPPDLEWDGLDEGCVHLLAEDELGRPVGTLRLLAGGKIGRLAVLAPWRGRGVGQALMEAVLALAAERGLGELCLDAQVAAIPFYEPFGFRAAGPVFDDAGIPHRKMNRVGGA